MASQFLGDSLVTLLGGGLKGFAQGKQRQKQQNLARIEAQKKEDAALKKQEAELQKQNEIEENRQKFFGLLNAGAGISPQTPFSEVSKLRNEAVDAASRAGFDEKTALNLLDRSFVQPNQAPSLQDQAGLDLQKQKLLTERQRTDATKALADERKAKIRDIREKTRKRNAKELTDEQILEEIKDIQDLELNEDNSRVKKTLLERKKQIARDLARRNNIAIPSELQDNAAVDAAFNQMGLGFLVQGQQVQPPLRPGLQPQQQPSAQPAQEEQGGDVSDDEIRSYLESKGAPVTPANIKAVRDQLNAG